MKTGGFSQQSAACYISLVAALVDKEQNLAIPRNSLQFLRASSAQRKALLSPLLIFKIFPKMILKFFDGYTESFCKKICFSINFLL